MGIRITATFFTLAFTLCAFTPAFADPGKGHGNNKNSDAVRVHGRSDSDNVIVIDTNDRNTIHGFLRDKACPPGLAKKHNGCLPPGQAKQQYKIGEVLVMDRPRTIWQKLADAISPPPAGARYVRADNSVLLVSERDNRIIDIITGD